MQILLDRQIFFVICSRQHRVVHFIHHILIDMMAFALRLLWKQERIGLFERSLARSRSALQIDRSSAGSVHVYARIQVTVLIRSYTRKRSTSTEDNAYNTYTIYNKHIYTKNHVLVACGNISLQLWVHLTCAGDAPRAASFVACLVFHLWKFRLAFCTHTNIPTGSLHCMFFTNTHIEYDLNNKALLICQCALRISWNGQRKRAFTLGYQRIRHNRIEHRRRCALSFVVSMFLHLSQDAWRWQFGEATHVSSTLHINCTRCNITAFVHENSARCQSRIITVFIVIITPTTIFWSHPYARTRQKIEAVPTKTPALASSNKIFEAVFALLRELRSWMSRNGIFVRLVLAILIVMSNSSNVRKWERRRYQPQPYLVCRSIIERATTN